MQAREIMILDRWIDVWNECINTQKVENTAFTSNWRKEIISANGGSILFCNWRWRMGSEAMQVTKVYCPLLKAVEKHIGKEEYKKHFSDFITQVFWKRSALSDPLAAQQQIKLAHDYTFLLNNVHHQKDLLFSYNIAVDRSDEMKRILGNLLQVLV
ncbi:hypothetical protein NE237_019109 [Protea cynaroides]|uniref:Uncharacterized protein n=1 Tax=Protea cynaroides TaxID=273540 RepID=A0A9Q0QPN5_9MAGN|nr:hypothetical protein NE237_019109 [Protea cynaroides]